MESEAWSLIIDRNVRKATPLCTIWISQTSQNVICGLQRGTLIFKRFHLEPSAKANSDTAVAWKTYFCDIASEMNVLRGLCIFQ